MNSVTKNKKEPNQERKTEKKQSQREIKQSKIEDYLTGPPKKKKTYVIFAVGEQFDGDLAQTMYDYVNRTYPQLSTSQPKTTEELIRQSGRSISLLILDDEFDQPEIVMKVVRHLKEKRRKEQVPVLFLTRNAEKLVERYHKELLPYHETDEFLVYPGITRAKLFARIKHGIDERNHRRSRRYNSNIPIRFFHLATDRWSEAKIVDLSVHGALITSTEDQIFRNGEQIKLQIPVDLDMAQTTGDFIRIAARVRRVFISGTQVAISFEHVTDHQFQQITEFVTNHVTRKMKYQSIKLKQTVEDQSKDQ
jgi:CheY-like chemotaxis protein